jgi:hypothetical protein
MKTKSFASATALRRLGRDGREALAHLITGFIWREVIEPGTKGHPTFDPADASTQKWYEGIVAGALHRLVRKRMPLRGWEDLLPEMQAECGLAQ